MPLINFRTNLTSLQYGMDRPGGGNSGQPFKQFPIEDASTPDAFKRYYEANRTSLDFPVRGGAISQLLSGEFGIISSTIDRERIQEFFKSAPRGKAFIDKQRGLQLTNPRTQVPNTITFASDSLGNIFLPVTNVYEPTNTLAQVQVMGTGAFINRHGLAPTIYEDPKRTYAYIAGAPQNNRDVTNRLSILWALKLLDSTDFLSRGTGGPARGIDPDLVTRMGISPLQGYLFNYQGGPGSVYGIGFTRIRRTTNTRATELLADETTGFTVNGISAPQGVSKPYSTIALTYQQLAEQKTRDGRSAVNPLIQDFRAQTNVFASGSKGPVIPFSNYGSGEGTKFNIALTSAPNIGVGNPGQPGSRVNYASSSLGDAGSDTLNLRGPFYFNPASIDPWTAAGQENTAPYSKDIIKFAFECLDNSGNNAIGLIFRAFLDGQISDNNQASYNEFKYLGRGETFRTYQGFDRTIGFAFKVFVQSRQEMQPLYKKLNTLISQVYPDYSAQYSIMRGNVVRLTIGDYIYRTPGFLENVNVSIDNNTTPWEILLGMHNESAVRQLPHMVTVQCSFKPILDILPRKVSYESPFVPLIANKDRYLDPSAATTSSQQELLLKTTGVGAGETGP